MNCVVRITFLVLVVLAAACARSDLRPPPERDAGIIRLDDSANAFADGVFAGDATGGAGGIITLTPSGTAGAYESPVLTPSAGGTFRWTTLAWLPGRPSLKALPDGRQAETGYPAGNIDMRDNVLLLHYDGPTQTIADGASIPDSSGGGHVGVASATNDSLTRVGGVVNEAIHFAPIEVTDGFTFPASPEWDRTPTSTRTIAYWLQRTGDMSHSCTLQVYGADSSGVCGPLPGACYYAEVLSDTELTYWDNLSHIAVGTADQTLDEWHHQAIVIDAGALTTTYFDAAPLATEVADSSALVAAGLRVGWNHPLRGVQDELAMWNRPLSAAEIESLYLRGALRIRFRVRSCDDPSCAGEAWMGPDGSEQTSYSEAMSTSLEPPVLPLTNVPDNAYFQLRIELETDSATHRPEVLAVEVAWERG